jgi:hypothetical protein
MLPGASPTKAVVSRRKLLASGATLAVGGGALAMVGTRPAAASVELSVPDESTSGQDGSVAGISLAVEGVYEWQADSADAVALTLAVAPPDTTDWAAIDTLERSASGTSGQGQFGLSGSVLDHAAWDAQDFSADAGETTTQDVAVRVAIEVTSGGETVVSDAATTTATVSVENTSVAAEVAVSAEGAITVTV